MIAYQDYDVRDTEGRRAAHVVPPFAIVIFVVGGINPHAAAFCDRREAREAMATFASFFEEIAGRSIAFFEGIAAT